MRLLDLCAGIGGFTLGLERAGFTPAAFCEIDYFCQRVLAKHWPNVPCYDDVRTLTEARLRANGVDVDAICGGFPCQDVSEAGRRAGLDAARSGLWSEFVRLTDELRPRVLIVENVSNLLAGPPERPGGWFGRVLGDLAEIGYDAEWHSIPACALDAPHERDRVWIVAYPRGQQYEGASPPLWGTAAARLLEAYSYHAGPRSSDDRGRQALAERTGRGALDDGDCSNGGRDHWRVESPLDRMAHGIPHRLDRLGGLGNAVVPQVAEVVGRAVLSAFA
jgi:DNA (cytosine-5)-methyltransferase 1